MIYISCRIACTKPKYFKNFSIVLEYFQVCQWITAPWKKRKRYWYVKSLHHQKTKRDMAALERFLNEVKWHSQVIWMFTTFRGQCLLSEKQMLPNCSFMHTFEEKTFPPLQMQRHGPIICAKLDWTLFDICTPFYLSMSLSQTRIMEFIIFTTAIFTEICSCSSWKRCTFL